MSGGKFSFKHQVNWNTVCSAIQDLPWCNIWFADNPVEVLNEHLLLLVGRYVPTNFIRVSNKVKPRFDDQCRHAIGLKQEAHIRWTRDRFRVNWKEFDRCQVRANETYSDAKRMLGLLKSDRPLLKSSVFGLSSSLPPLIGWGGGLVFVSVGKTDLLSDHFDSKLSRVSGDLPLTCHLSPRLATVAFRSSEVRHLLLDLHPRPPLTNCVCFLSFLRELLIFWPLSWCSV